MNIDTDLADNEMIIANTIQTIVLKSLNDLEWCGTFSDEGLLTDMIDCDAYSKMITAFENKKMVVVITGQYRYDYDGGLCTRVLDYKVI